MSKEIKIEDLLNLAGDNVYDTEYSMKLSIPVRTSTHNLFKELKNKLNNEMGMKINNARLFEFMVVELYNSNLKSLK
jgi:flagellin-specific chaperone FliS|tara:strand:+ start:1016 stop:1246 length:231 start_codon:yes stop_codon:yes gene_type:complete